MQRPGRGAGLIALTLTATLPCVVWAGFPEQFELPRLLLLTLGGVAALACLAFNPRLPVPDAALDWVVLFALLVAGVGTATSSDWRGSLWGVHESFGGLFTWLGLAAFYAAARTLCFGQDGWARALLAGMTVVVVYAFVQAGGWDLVSWTRTATWCERTRPFSTLGHPNVLAGYLAISAPLVAGWGYSLWRSGRRREAAGTFVVLVGGAVACALTLSRAGWLALAVGMLVCGVLLTRLGMSARRVSVMVVCAVIAGGAMVALSPPLRQRVATLLEAPARTFIYRGAVAIFREEPLLGAGLDQFQVAFMRHREPAYWAHEWGRTPQRAHNDPLHALATLGLPGGVLVLVGCFGAAGAVRSAWRQRDGHRRAQVAGAAGAFTAGAIHGALNFHVIGTWVPLLLGAALLGGPPARVELPTAGRALVRGVALLMAAALLVFGVIRPAVGYALARSSDAHRAGDPLAALELSRRAFAWAPWSDWHAARLGSLAGELRMEGAEEALLRAVRQAPANAYHHASLGRYYARFAHDLPLEARERRSLEHYDRALILDPANALLRYDATESALATGAPARARALAERLVSTYPDWGGGWAVLGDAALAEGSELEAQAFFEQAVTRPWHGEAAARTRAITRIARALETLGKYADAQAVLQTLSKGPPSDGCR